MLSRAVKIGRLVPWSVHWANCKNRPNWANHISCESHIYWPNMHGLKHTGSSPV